MSVIDVRLQMQANGFQPIPCTGKRPSILGWQGKTSASAAEMRTWSGANTGCLTAYTPAIDIDITILEAAELAEQVARELFSDRGVMLTRFGRLPRRALPLRARAPFPKMSASFEAPNGTLHKVEVLADGQQFICFGIHPDTGEPYTWFGDSTPLNTPREDLAEVTAADMQAYLELVSERLVEECNFRRTFTNGHDDEAGAGPVDVDTRLAEMRFGGGDNSVHATQLATSASLLRGGVSFDETVRIVLDATKKAVSGDPRAQGWDWDDEKLAIERMCASFVSKNQELAYLLPAGLREQFEQKRDAGRGPNLVWRRDRLWHVASAPGMGDKRFGRVAPGNLGPKTEGTAAPQSELDPLPIEARPFRRFDPAALPPREWLYAGHYQRGIVTATVGPGGGGKSSLNLVELIAMFTGRPLLGEQPVTRCRVWYHNAEDGEDEIYRRIAAICQHYGVSQDELDGWLFVTSGIAMPIKVAVTRAGSVQVNTATTAAIIRTVTDNEIKVVSFDPLVAHHAATENATGYMDLVIREFARIANVTDCSIEIVHHTRKPAPGREELGIVDSRGAGAIINAVCSARVLNTMSESEADSAGIDDVDRQLHFRIDRGKANMAPPTAARWHKFLGVTLPSGDNVGVATHWTFPGQGLATEEMAAVERKAEDLFISLLVRFTGEGRKVNANAGASYAPSVFSKERTAKAAKIGKAALTAAMGRLFEANRIRVEQAGGKEHYANRIVIVTDR